MTPSPVPCALHGRLLAVASKAPVLGEPQLHEAAHADGTAAHVRGHAGRPGTDPDHVTDVEAFADVLEEVARTRG